MKALVLGADGQLGVDVAIRLETEGYDVVRANRSTIDVTRPFDAGEVAVIVNCAAYTAVDKAETDREAAFAVNAEGPRNAAIAARNAGARLVHVSTDYVFDGTLDREYRTDDATGPLCVYGASKLEGERLCREALPEATIVRTSWVFSRRMGFPKTILGFAQQRDRLEVVADEIGRPTWTVHLADACLRLAGRPGTFHAAGSPVVSRHAFTERILELARPRLAIRTTEVARTRLADSPRPARRPEHAVLALDPADGLPIYDWQDGVADVIESLRS